MKRLFSITGFVFLSKMQLLETKNRHHKTNFQKNSRPKKKTQHHRTELLQPKNKNFKE